MGIVKLLPLGFAIGGSRPRLVTAMIGLLLLTIASMAGYQRLFSSFAPYDDEGYMMISLRMYLAGHPLYDETYTQYGPAFYALNALLHQATTLSVSHDVTRIKTLVAWLATAAMCAAFIYRTTRSPLIACLSLLAVYFHLDRLGLEPGHPQDLCLLAISATLLLGTWIGRSADCTRVRSSLAMAVQPDVWLSCVMGLLSAAVAMTKINIGGLLFAGVAMALLLASPRGRVSKALLGLSVVGVVLLPFTLARQHVLELEGVQLPVVVLASVASVLVAVRRADVRGFVSAACWWAFAAGFGMGCLLFTSVALVHGTSWTGLMHGMFWQHLGFMEGFYENPPIYSCAAPLAVLGVIATITSLRGWPLPARLVRLGLVVMLVGVCLRHLADSFTPIPHGASDRGQAALLVSLFTPLLWVLFLPYCERGSRDDPWLQQTRFSRLLLCTIALLQPLGVYPVPGTQMALGSLGLLLALLICVSDLFRFPTLLGTGESMFRRALAGGLIGLALLTVVCRATHLRHQRQGLTPLGLAGAERLRLPADYVAKKQWTVNQLRSRAETFICMQNGHNSLYLWSQIDPPTPINTTLWQDVLSDEQQRRIIASLVQHKRVCVVWESSEPLPHRRDGPLTRYVLDNFRPAVCNGSTEIWVPEN